MSSFRVTTVDYSQPQPKVVVLESKTGTLDMIVKHYDARCSFYRSNGYKSSGYTLKTEEGTITNLDKGSSMIRLTVNRI